MKSPICKKVFSYGGYTVYVSKLGSVKLTTIDPQDFHEWTINYFDEIDQAKMAILSRLQDEGKYELVNDLKSKI